MGEQIFNFWTTDPEQGLVLKYTPNTIFGTTNDWRNGGILTFK